MLISKSILGVTGEYYVAAELGKRNIFAQLTFGNQKKTDLLVFSENGKNIVKIEVKNKQGNQWPNVKGIEHGNSLIVFVDFQNLKETQRPDFYILNEENWRELIEKKKNEYEIKYPDRKVSIENNCLIFENEISKYGKPYKGLSVKPKDIEQFKENWKAIVDVLSSKNTI